VIDRTLVAEVRARTDLVALVGEHRALRKEGRNYVTRCPFHDERSASFKVSKGSDFFFCFGCKVGGDAISFYQRIEGVSFLEALRALAQRAGIEVPEERDPERIAEDRRQHDQADRLLAACEAATEFFVESLASEEFSDIARGALADRGRDDATVQAFRLGYAPARWDALAAHLAAHGVSPADGETAGLLVPGKTGRHYDRFRHRLMFPVCDRSGKVVAFSGRILPLSEAIPEGIVPAAAGKYINSPETPLYRKGDLLYGLDRARPAMQTGHVPVLVEGNFDVVQMHQHGFVSTVAPLGTSFTAAQAKLLRRYAESVVLLFDGDEAGRKATRAACETCRAAGLGAKVVSLGVGAKEDPDSFLRSADPGKGAVAMVERLRNPPDILEWMIQDVGAHAGDSVNERVASMRQVAPSIAAVEDRIAQQGLVEIAADALRLRIPQAWSAVHDAARAARAARGREGKPDDATRRGHPIAEGEVQDPGGSGAHAIEALLSTTALFGTQEALRLSRVVAEPLVPFTREAVRQWSETGTLDRAALLALAPSSTARLWIGARLVVEGDASERVVTEDRQALGDAVRLLEREARYRTAVRVGRGAVRAGVAGDPRGAEAQMQERIATRRSAERETPR
jgi:DNA primase